MEDMLYYSELYDYYKGLLTDKEKEYFEEYYFDNLSLQEIAENFKVSKNAISKSLIEAKEKLDYYESNLHLLKNKNVIKGILSTEDFEKIGDYI